MTTLTQNSSIHGSDYESEQSLLKMPNPGDVFILVAFAWATICFLMVVGGDTIARRLAIMSRSQVVRDVLLTEQSAIAMLMVGGMVGLAIAFYLITRFRMLAIMGLFFSMSFSNASWLPLYYVSFAVKYIVLAYLGAYTALFFIKNGWRLIATDGYRLVCAYVGWIAFVALLNGFAFADLWYLTTEFCLMIGLGIAWYSDLDSTRENAQVLLCARVHGDGRGDAAGGVSRARGHVLGIRPLSSA